MFLSNLKSRQKELFLDLAIKAAEVNSEMVFAEKNMLKAFALELNITPRYSTEKKTGDIIDELKHISSVVESKIILFEILGILVSDAEFDNREKEFISNIAAAFNMEKKIIDDMMNLIKEYALLYNRIYHFVIG